MPQYDYQSFEVTAPPELGGGGEAKSQYPVAIIGAGPIGLAAAVDLALRGIPSVVLDDNNVVSIGSRAICWAKRTLEIFDRLGVGERMLEKGVTWKTGRLFHGADEVYNFDLLPEDGHKYPAFINLQQYYVEQYLVERALEFPDLIDLRFNNKVVNHADKGDQIALDVETDFGAYTLNAEYVLACEGAGSPTRKRMELAFEGQTFEEHFLIADVEMDESPFETEEAERWFWFEPEFHPGQSALLHKQPDNIYRIDLQLGPDADPKAEAVEEKVFPRIKAMVGDKPFKLDWMSVYKFRCAKLERFVHGRMIFVGDSAETYNEERVHGSAENIKNSSRATNFMTPKSPVEHMFRNEVLKLSKDMPFARKLINSGRLSVPCSLAGMALQNDNESMIGHAVIDAPLSENNWLVSVAQGAFTLVGFGDVKLPEVAGIKRIGIAQATDEYPTYEDISGHALARYGEGKAYLFVA